MKQKNNMAKLQKIKRSNGSIVYSVNIPKEIIDDINWEKGEELDLEATQDESGNKIIIVSKQPDEE